MSPCRTLTLIYFLCVLFVSPWFITNSLVLTVREPNETQSLFLLYHRRNEEEIMTYSCVEISVIRIVNSQNSRNSLHIVISYCTKYIYWNTHITHGRESVFFPSRTHHRGWYPSEKKTKVLLASTHDSDFKDDGVCVVGNLQSKIKFEYKVLNALHPWLFTTEVKSTVYLTNSIYRYWDKWR